MKSGLGSQRALKRMRAVMKVGSGVEECMHIPSERVMSWRTVTRLEEGLLLPAVGGARDYALDEHESVATWGLSAGAMGGVGGPTVAAAVASGISGVTVSVHALGRLVQRAGTVSSAEMRDAVTGLHDTLMAIPNRVIVVATFSPMMIGEKFWCPDRGRRLGHQRLRHLLKHRECRARHDVRADLPRPSPPIQARTRCTRLPAAADAAVTGVRRVRWARHVAARRAAEVRRQGHLP